MSPRVISHLIRAGTGLGVGVGLVLTPSIAVADTVHPGPGAVVAIHDVDSAQTDDEPPPIDLGWAPTPAPDAPTAAPDESAPSPAQEPHDPAQVPTPTPGEQPTTPPAVESGPHATPDAVPEPAPTEPAPTEPAPTEPAPAPTIPDSAEESDHPGDIVIVKPGDTLWGIAATWLGANPSAAAIVDAVAHLYATNQAVIGPDPNLILPGQRLALPG
jgi:LysM repeat protein